MYSREVSSQRDQVWNRGVSVWEKSLLPCPLFSCLLTLPFVTDHNCQLWLYADHFLSCMQPLHNPVFWSFFELLTLTNLLLSQFLHNSLYLPVVAVEGVIRKTKHMTLWPLLLPQGRELKNELGDQGWQKLKRSRRLSDMQQNDRDTTFYPAKNCGSSENHTISSAFHPEPSGFSKYDWKHQ